MTARAMLYRMGEQGAVWERVQHISHSDRGFALGDALFETVLVRNGKPFRIESHLSRLRRSADFFGIADPPDLASWVAELLATVGADSRGDERLRVTLSRGDRSSPGVRPTGTERALLVLELSGATGPGAGSARAAHPLRLAWAPSRRNERAASAGHKTTSYADAVLELSRAHAAGADDCLFLDSMDHISEASSSNIFLYDGEVLATPALSCGALPGITREIVLGLAREAGIAVEERVVEREEAALASELFLTSSIRGIAPAVLTESGPAASSSYGICEELSRRYEKLLQSECPP